MLTLGMVGRYERRRRRARIALVAGVLVPCLTVTGVFGLKTFDVRSESVDILGMRKHSNALHARQSETKQSGTSTGHTLPVVNSSTLPDVKIASAESLAWEQDFSKMPNGPLNTGIWQFEVGGDGWGNNEAQYYTDSQHNAYIEDGRMVIEARKEQMGDVQYTSARVITRQTFTPQYGTIVFEKVRMPKGVGTWPALWLWPSTNRYTAEQMSGTGDSGLVNGEIDIMEYVGAAPGEINASAHAYANYPGHGERSGQTQVVDATQEHDYSFHWTATTLTFAVDGKPFYVLSKKSTDSPATWPYDQPYFLIINLAMGGDWGGMNKAAFPPLGIDNTSGPWKFSLGAVRYYKE